MFIAKEGSYGKFDERYEILSGEAKDKIKSAIKAMHEKNIGKEYGFPEIEKYYGEIIDNEDK